jgi:phosphoribosylanthranilate isomerase
MYSSLLTFAQNSAMLATKVLAAGITHLTDARYFAAWEVDFLAFPIGDGAGENITWTYLNAMREWVEGPAIVAELGSIADGAAWAAQLTENRVTFALLDHSAPASAQNDLRTAGIELIGHVKVEGYQDTETIKEAMEEVPDAKWVVLDFTHGGIAWDDLEEGKPISLQELEDLSQGRQVLVQIDLGDRDPKAVNAAYSIAGFAVRGSSEEKVGYKSFDDLDGLFEGLEVFD